MTQQCGICWEDSAQVESLGVIDSCNHLFCYSCISQWAQVDTNCPLCKQRFKQIIREFISLSKPTQVILLEEKNFKDQKGLFTIEELEYQQFIDGLTCQFCRSGDNEEVLLICDTCNEAFHTHCVGLSSVPNGNFICPCCIFSENISNIQVLPEQQVQQFRQVLKNSFSQATQPRPYKRQMQQFIKTWNLDQTQFRVKEVKTLLDLTIYGQVSANRRQRFENRQQQQGITVPHQRDVSLQQQQRRQRLLRRRLILQDEENEDQESLPSNSSSQNDSSQTSDRHAPKQENTWEQSQEGQSEDQGLDHSDNLLEDQKVDLDIGRSALEVAIQQNQIKLKLQKLNSTKQSQIRKQVNNLIEEQTTDIEILEDNKEQTEIWKQFRNIQEQDQQSHDLSKASSSKIKAELKDDLLENNNKDLHGASRQPLGMQQLKDPIGRQVGQSKQQLQNQLDNKKIMDILNIQSKNPQTREGGCLGYQRRNRIRGTDNKVEKIKPKQINFKYNNTTYNNNLHHKEEKQVILQENKQYLPKNNYNNQSNIYTVVKQRSFKIPKLDVNEKKINIDKNIQQVSNKGKKQGSSKRNIEDIDSASLAQRQKEISTEKNSNVQQQNSQTTNVSQLYPQNQTSLSSETLQKRQKLDYKHDVPLFQIPEIKIDGQRNLHNQTLDESNSQDSTFERLRSPDFKRQDTITSAPFLETDKVTLQQKSLQPDQSVQQSELGISNSNQMNSLKQQQHVNTNENSTFSINNTGTQPYQEHTKSQQASEYQQIHPSSLQKQPTNQQVLVSQLPTGSNNFLQQTPYYQHQHMNEQSQQQNMMLQRQPSLVEPMQGYTKMCVDRDQGTSKQYTEYGSGIQYGKIQWLDSLDQTELRKSKTNRSLNKQVHRQDVQQKVQNDDNTSKSQDTYKDSYLFKKELHDAAHNIARKHLNAYYQRQSINKNQYKQLCKITTDHFYKVLKQSNTAKMQDEDVKLYIKSKIKNQKQV